MHYATLRKWFQGCTFCLLWYSSICSGFLVLYCPLLPLLLINQTLFRRLTDAVFAAWEMYPVAMLECVLGTQIVVTGDKILPQDRALLIMNHRTRLDWNFLWAAMFHACQPLAHRLKFVLKSPIRHCPGPGWVMQMNCFLYIHRRWERDKALLARTIDYLADIQYTYQILLFPEGTDLTPKSQQRSNQFAAAHQLERYTQVLHPKTTGFVFLTQRMRERDSLDAVYDLSIGYPCNLPQSEMELMRGNFPRQVHFHITRYPTSCLPSEDLKLKEWLSDLWRSKEANLIRFYETGSFLRDQTTASPVVNLSKQTVQTLSDLTLPNLAHDSTSASAIPSPDYSDLKTPTTPCNAMHCANKPRPNDILDKKDFYGCKNDVDKLMRFDSTMRAYNSNALYLALMFWTSLSALTGYMVLTSAFVFYYAVVHCLLFVFLSLVCEGINHLEISLHEYKRRLMPCRHERG